MISELYSEKLVGYERTDGIGLEKSSANDTLEVSFRIGIFDNVCMFILSVCNLFQL